MMDWGRAENYLGQIETAYKELIGVEGVNPNYALVFVIRPLRLRFDNGERTQDLHDAIMELE